MGDADDSDKRIVKLYLLSDDSWDDRGTGFVEVVPSDGGHSIVMTSKDSKSDEVLLNVKVSKDDIYQLQGESLIVWNDPWLQQDIALSFQVASACISTWQEIRGAQSRPVGAVIEEEEDIFEQKILPEVKLSGLGEIVSFLATPPATLHQKDCLMRELLRDGYIDKLLDMHEQCEDLDDISSLQQIFIIFKSLMLLNSPELLQELFVSDRIMKVIATLEFDPLLTNKPQHYRQFLEQKVQFHDILQLPEEIKVKVHRAFRIQYIKETALARYLDDPTYATINVLLVAAHVELLNSFADNDELLGRVSHMVQSGNIEEAKPAVLLVQEMTFLARALSPVSKGPFFMALGGLQFFDQVTNLLVSKEPSVELAVADILWQAANQEPTVMRHCCVSLNQKDNNFPILRNIVCRLLKFSDDSIQGQLAEVLKLLVEGDVTKQPELNELLQTFYDNLFELFVSAISNPETDSATLIHLLDLISFCVMHHTLRISNIILDLDVIRKIVGLLDTPRTVPLTLAVTRFIKAVVVCKLDDYNTNIASHDLLHHLIQLFLDNGVRTYNMLNSSILSICEFIRCENVNILIKYVVSKYWEKLQNVKNVHTFSQLHIKYQALLVQEEEEAAAAPTATSSVGALVSYGEGEDEPPAKKQKQEEE